MSSLVRSLRWVGFVSIMAVAASTVTVTAGCSSKVVLSADDDLVLVPAGDATVRSSSMVLVRAGTGSGVEVPDEVAGAKADHVSALVRRSSLASGAPIAVLVSRSRLQASALWFDIVPSQPMEVRGDEQLFVMVNPGGAGKALANADGSQSIPADLAVQRKGTVKPTIGGQVASSLAMWPCTNPDCEDCPFGCCPACSRPPGDNTPTSESESRQPPAQGVSTPDR